MKICLACGTHFPALQSLCPQCDWTPELIDRFPAYAPNFARSGPGFNPASFSRLAGLEARHFWFRARNKLIVWALDKYCANFQSFLEVGCGTGYVLSAIAEACPRALLQGSEIFTAGLRFASARAPQINFIQMDAKNIPYAGEFDAIGAFDVLEHIEEDETVLKQIYKALKSDGVVLMTVPQHAWLWSPVDDNAHHVRRYSARELRIKMENAGFEILRSTSFVSSLLPAMLASRMTKKSNSSGSMDATAELTISTWMNRLFEVMLMAEVALIRLGIDFPIGGSLLIAARKPTTKRAGG